MALWLELNLREDIPDSHRPDQQLGSGYYGQRQYISYPESRVDTTGNGFRGESSSIWPPR